MGISRPLSRTALSLAMVSQFAGCSSADTSTAPDAAIVSDAPEASSIDVATPPDAPSRDSSEVDASRPDTSLDASPDAPPDAPLEASGCSPVNDAGAPVLLYTLNAAAFPDASTPSVAVHIPPGFDPSNRPGAIVFFHGFDNCVTNVVGDTDAPCADGGPARAALHLVDQLDKARVNAILVAVELAVDQPTGNPGQLATPGKFHALLHELFTEHLDTVLGCQLDVDGLDRVVVSAHSGGDQAAASVLQYGMVPAVREVDLLDSLFGESAVFDSWIEGALARFDPARPDGMRWADIYTASDGTATNSRAMAANAESWFADAGLSGSVLDDDTLDTLDAGAYAHPVLFKLSGLAVDQVPQFYFQALARASGFAVLP